MHSRWTLIANGRALCASTGRGREGKGNGVSESILLPSELLFRFYSVVTWQWLKFAFQAQHYRREWRRRGRNDLLESSVQRFEEAGCEAVVKDIRRRLNSWSCREMLVPLLSRCSIA